MKLKVIACGVFEPYIRRLEPDCPHRLDVHMLDAGLHAHPAQLRLTVQAEIDNASAGTHDAVILLYGLCGRGTDQLVSRDVPVVFPRAHDCITLFLGSREAYMRQFHKNPGTYYHTLGWIDKKINPQNREASELYKNYFQVGFDKHPEFAKIAKEFGDENARQILAFFDRWRQHYSRAAYIDMGFPDEAALADFTRQMAGIYGWQYDRIQGDITLLKAMLNGQWDDSRVFVLPPRSRSRTTGDDRIFDAIAIDTSTVRPVPADAELTLQSAEPAPPPEGIGLGIDTGGTYTDAVIYDFAERKLIAKTKALTTYHNLAEGINNALTQLPATWLKQVQVTALSTTLGTNAIVEGRGHKVGVIVLSIWDWTPDEFDYQPLINIPGAVGVAGNIIEPLDEQACCRAVTALIEQERCAALVVVGYATGQNPEQANRVRTLIMEKYPSIPVVCAHEISRGMDMYESAETAIANARLLPIIRELMDAVRRTLTDLNVQGQLMVVKGDGTLVNESIACARPIETLLSGPAASVSGARLLTGLKEALVLDIGGTTTDCAIIHEGHEVTAADGVRVGPWVMNIDAVEVTSVGLGGDSRIDFTPERKLIIGPMRNLPLCYLADQYGSVNEHLEHFDASLAGSCDASALDFFIVAGSAALDLTERETELLAALKSGPLPVSQIVRKMNLSSPLFLPLLRLETCGIIKRSALTPTDLLHVTGQFVRWNVPAARRALEIFALLYGKPAEEVLRLAQQAVTRCLFEEIIRREISWENRRMHVLPEDWSMLLDKAFQDEGRGIKVKFSLRRPVIAIGAPAGVLAPPLAQHLDAEVIVPEHADVANALGAIGSEISLREIMTIRPGSSSCYVLHGTGECMEFAELDRATQIAVGIIRERVYRRAVEAGALAPEVRVTQRDQTGTVADGSRVFIERTIKALASGSIFSRCGAVKNRKSVLKKR